MASSSRRVVQQLERHHGIVEGQIPALVDAKSLDEAQLASSQRACFLAVYLHNPDHELTAQFVDIWFGGVNKRTLVSDPAPRSGWQLLPGPQELLWYMESVESEIGYRLQLALDVTTFPCLVVCFKKHVVSVLQGEITLDPPRVAAELQRGFHLWSSEVAKEVAFLHDKERRMLEEIEAQSAQEEQLRRDKALLEAFEAQEAERRRAQEEVQRAAKEAAAREQELREQLRKEQVEADRRRMEEEAAAAAANEALLLQKSLAASRLTDPPAPDADPRSVVCVCFRFPSSSVERRFSSGDTVEMMYLFAESHELFAGGTLQLAAGFPPKAIDRSVEEGKTLDAFFGSQRRVVVIVRHV